MRFNGRLQTDAEPEGWLKSELTIVGNKVELTAGDEVLGTWPVGQVKAERLEGDRFELHFGDDRAVFAADDALGFSYEAVPKLTRKPIVEAAQGFRKLLGGNRKAPGPPEVATPAPKPTQDPVEGDESEVPANVKRLKELIEAAKANRPEEAAPAETADDEFQMVEPSSARDPEPGPLWSMPESSYLPRAVEDPKPIALSIVDPIDLAPSFKDESALADEIDRLAEQVRTARLTATETEAAISMIRSLRMLLNR
jgi:hypothetical protein